MASTRPRTALLLLLSLGALLYLAPALTDAQDGGSSTPAPTGTPDPFLAKGEKIFATICIACHQAGGRGIEGVWPALAGNPLVTLDDPSVVTRTVLFGRGGMPRFNSLLSNEQIAAVISYIRGSLDGNAAGPITEEYVDQVERAVEAILTPTPEPVSADGQSPAASPAA